MKYTVVTLPLVMLLLSACGSETPTPAPVKKEVTQTVEKKAPPPKKEIELKEVEDTNYSAAYMYPEDSVKKEKVVEPIQTPLATDTGMNKEECIAMISQEKFDKYAAMFGSESASIKRCNMIQAMNQ